jgi:GNAT superfamily N-acetyltransferase
LQRHLPIFHREYSGKQEIASKKMIIRKGIPEDMPEVLALIKELAIFEKEPNAVVVTVEDLVRDGFSENPLFYTFVAEVQNKIIGVALYYYRFSTWKGKTIHLEDLIVKETNRGTGAGFALYTEIIKQGKKDNVRRIEWNVLDWNTPAIEFYKKSGATVLDDWRVVHMDEKGIETFINNIEKTTHY